MNKPSNKNFVNKTILAKSIVSCHIIRKVCLFPMTINITVGVDDGQSRYLRTKGKADKLWSIEESEKKSNLKSKKKGTEVSDSGLLEVALSCQKLEDFMNSFVNGFNDNSFLNTILCR